jgi:hypothetical protein
MASPTKGDEMPDQARSSTRVRRSALLARGAALTALLAIPGIGLAQTADSSTTTVLDRGTTTLADKNETKTTDSGSDTTTEDSQSNRSARGGVNCDHAEDTSTAEA